MVDARHPGTREQGMGDDHNPRQDHLIKVVLGRLSYPVSSAAPLLETKHRLRNFHVDSFFIFVGIPIGIIFMLRFRSGVDQLVNRWPGMKLYCFLKCQQKPPSKHMWLIVECD